MEVKKSHKADLERRRPYVLVASLCGVTLFFIGILFFPYKQVGKWIDESFEDFAMDMELEVKKDEYISAVPPQQKKPDEKATQLNKVDEAPIEEPEMMETPPEAVDETKEQVDEEPPINPDEDDEEKMKIVEELPKYPGGMVEFMKWLTKTLQYPKAALKQNVQGKVIISFIVNEDGSLSNIKVEKGAHRWLDSEALRVARMMPAWEPGIENGKPCRSKVAIPIVFEI